MNIFVAKLSPNTTEQDLRTLFEEYGEVTSAKVIMDRDTGRSKRYGFVEMSDDDEANRAIQELNDSDFNNSQIIVKTARPREEAPRQRHQRSSYGNRY